MSERRADASAFEQVEHAHGHYVRAVADLTLRYYRGLFEAGREYGERLAAGLTMDDGTARHGADDVARPTMRLRGALGSTVEATFTVENSDLDAVDVSVEVGDCRAPDGTRFAAPVEVRPSTATIPAGGRVRLTLRADLRSDVFQVGGHHELPVHLHGPQATTVDVTIDVEDADEPKTGAPPDGPPFTVRCPRCDRTFERQTEDLRLRPHKHPDGTDCPHRDGERA